MACSGLQLEMPHDRAQGIRLIVGAERRKFAAGLRRGALAASAEIIHAEDPVVAGIDAEARPDDLGPPSLAAAPATMRCAEMPPRTAMTGASSGPTSRKATRASGNASP